MFDALPKGGGDKTVLRAVKLRELTTIVPSKYVYVQTDEQMRDMQQSVERAKLCSFDTETTGLGWDDQTVAVAISTGPRTWWIPTAMVHSMRNFETHEVRESLGDIFENPAIIKVAHGAKFDKHRMKNSYGITTVGLDHCTLLAQWILNENERHDLETVCKTWLGHEDWKIKQDGSFNVWPLKMASMYICHDAEATLELYAFQQMHLRLQPKLWSLMYDVEMPTLEIAYDMEQRGFGWDSVYYDDVMKPEVNQHCDTAEIAVRDVLGNINLDSPQQVAGALFNGLHLPQHNGNSVDKKTLAALREKHPVIGRLEEYRKYSTLRKMFIDQLPSHVFAGRIHCNLKTIGTRTGRMACTDPNLQQLPKQSVGPLVRRAFIPSEGCVLITMDYSQIELRILAHLSGDKEMMAAFKRGDDIHMSVTSRMFGIDLELLKADKKAVQENPLYVTLRVISKTINFGILYGMGPSLLMDTINDRVRAEDQIDLDRAAQLVEEWFGAYPAVRRYIYKQQGLAAKNGYVETLLGRKRRLPDARSADRQVAAYAERQAGNAPIQGSAGDMIKVAAIRIQALLREEHWPIQMLLQVHDELVMEAPIAWLRANPDALDEIKKAMRDAITISVPVEVSVEVLSRWGDRYIEEDDYVEATV